MENNVDTIIGINVTIKGNIYNKGSIQVNGFIEGEVKSDENIIIGDTARVKGPVIAKKIEISGEVRGLIEASDKLELNPTGKAYGDVNAKTLIIKEGATFVGKSIMPAETSGQPADTESKEEEKKDEPKPANDDKLGFFAKK